MKVHGRCRRYVRTHGENREILSLRVLYCEHCHRYHRELPDFIIPYKHISAKLIAHIYDALSSDYVDIMKHNYPVDGSTARRIWNWTEQFLRFGAATVRRLKLEHPTLTTKYDSGSTLETLRYFVKVTANANEWKFNQFALTVS
jgi:hypothetical protein